MKNIIKITTVILIVFAMGISLVCCSGSVTEDTTAAEQTTTAEEVTVTEEVTDAETEAEIQMPYACVSVYDGAKIVAAEVKVAKADEDEDGKWTINDALITLHKDKCADGFATTASDYGPMISKLWGVENGGAYGYYKNNAMCMSITEELSEETADHIYAYVYSDAAAYSDVYSFFDKDVVSGNAGDKVTLTLKYVTFDEAYNTVEVPLADATITFDGEATEFKTDENGAVEITLPAAKAVISAVKDGAVIIPPVCVYEA